MPDIGIKAPAAGLRTPGKLRGEGRFIGLLFASTTSIIGSGWLFGAYHATRIAGPLAIWSWVVGAFIILAIAFCFAELGALFPRSGALVHMSHASHGEGLGRIWAWMLFLAYVATPAVESEAVVTYANNYLPYFIKHGSHGLLTPVGFAVCAVAVGIFAVLNLLAVRWLLHVNSTVTWWKIAIPALTGIALLVGTHRGGALSADPHGYSVNGIFVALPAAGIIFSYLGFRTAIDLGGESANPHRDIPLAVIVSVILSAAIYILLQFAFLYALSPTDVAHGWAKLSFAGQTGPFAGLAMSVGMAWLAALLYADAYVSPSGTAFMSVTAGSRILYGIGETRCGPRWLTALTGAKIPWAAILVMWVVGILFLLPFPAWQLLVAFITSIGVLTYGLGPIALLVLRRNLPEGKRHFELKAAWIIAPLAFVLSNLVIYWTGFRTDSILFAIIAGGFILWVGYHRLIAGLPSYLIGWRHISWLLPWFAGLWVLSALSGIGGGVGVLGFWPGVVLVVIWSLLMVRLALAMALSPSETQAIMARMDAVA
jgi:amino acid transporter